MRKNPDSGIGDSPILRHMAAVSTRKSDDHAKCLKRS